MDGCCQLPAEEMQVGRSIASLRIHVERAIGWMKQYKIVRGVTVCSYLNNFHPGLVPNTTFSASPLDSVEGDGATDGAGDGDSDMGTESEFTDTSSVISMLTLMQFFFSLITNVHTILHEGHGEGDQNDSGDIQFQVQHKSHKKISVLVKGLSPRSLDQSKFFQHEFLFCINNEITPWTFSHTHLTLYLAIVKMRLLEF